KHLLTAVVEGKPTIPISLNLRPEASQNPEGNGVEQATLLARREDQYAESNAVDHSSLYNLLDKRIRRHAELSKRETGVHALWLGYPLLYVPADGIESGQWV